MENTQIQLYRTTIETQLKEKETEIENTISYINTGLLALFLTINEKYVPFNTSVYKSMMYISIASLVISFVLGLYSKYKTTQIDRHIIKVIDEESDANKATNANVDNKIYLIWENGDMLLQKLRKVIYILLSVGLVTQIFYFFFNLSNLSETEKLKSINIQQLKNDTTIKLEKAQLKIYYIQDTIK